MLSYAPLWEKGDMLSIFIIDIEKISFCIAK